MNEAIQKKIEFPELEQELYDVLLDEYNDIFENILNLEENQIFDKILINSKAILGPNKMQLYSEETIAKIISYIKESIYNSDSSSLKPLKKYINSFSKKNKSKLLEIDDIFAHCRDCSQCYHTCGQILLKFTSKNNSTDYIICSKCKMVYKKNLIHLYCKECQEEYYSYIVDDSEPDYENYYPATWEKYHCPNFIYEEMTCPKCDNMLYYNEKIQLLKCFECNWKCNANNKKWRCELCNEEFSSPVKEYVRFETKPKVNCVRDALVEKVLAMPPVDQCCEGGWESLSKIGFRHVNNDNTKNCNGIYYLGHLQNKKVVVCSECRLVQQFKDVYWECPNCLKIFRCKKKKEKKKTKKKVCNISQNKTLLKDDKNNAIFQRKKIHGFYKSEKRKENKKIVNNFKVFRKMDSSHSDDFEPFGTIVSKKIKQKNISKNNINLAKININININRSNNEDEDTLDDNNSKSEKEDQNDNDINNNYSKEKKSKKFCKNKNKFSFYKKPKNILYNNIMKLKKEKKDNASFNKDNSDNFLRISKNANCSSLIEKKEKKENKNLSLNNLISLRNQKYVSIGKFNKSLNEKSLALNQNFPNSVSKNKNYKYNQIKTKLIHSNKKINLNINVNNFNNRSNSINKNDIENNLKNNSLDKKQILLEDNSTDKVINNSSDSTELDDNFNLEEFKFIKQIGEGTFGKIYSTKWDKNGKEYALKKMFLKTKAEIKKNKEQTDLVYNFLKKTGNNGVVKIYGCQYKSTEDNTKDKTDKKTYEYNFYVLMELAEIDWEKEINKRKLSKNYYTEGEIYKIMRQLIKSFSALQKNYITHRDIKPQNILIVNNNYKIGDFGEAKITEGSSIIKQSIKGTELYMSPILFTALSKRQSIIIHNTFKSDVFSLGMCLFLAATLTFKSLYDIREVKDSKVIKKILEKYLIVKYSYNFVNILVKMLEVDENLRPDFIELENDFFYK